MKKILATVSVIIALILAVSLSACNGDSFINPGDKLGGGGNGDVAQSVNTSTVESTIDGVIEKTDFDKYTEDSSDSQSSVPETNDDNVVIIESSGTYTLDGAYKQVVLKGSGLEINLILNNASISNPNGVAIDGTTSGKKLAVTLTLASGTQNTVENGGDNVNAIHIKGSLVINGDGKLTVVSSSKSAIKASKQISVVNADIALTAANHALTGANIVAANCSINVASAGKDGINAECDDATEFTYDDGYVYLNNVNYTCNVSGDGIQADTWICIDGGNCNITTEGIFVVKSSDNMQKYGMTADDFRYRKVGGSYQKIAGDEAARYSSLYGLVQSAKGLKVGEIEYTDDSGADVTVTEGDYCIRIKNGNFVLSCTDDAIHANSGDVIIDGGQFEISTLDDGITADGAAKISSGKIDVITSYEGIEGGYVEISGGTIDVTASDDGINAASDDSKITEHIIISGGEVTVNASGDGLDSNGSILISGGVVIVHGPTNGGDAGLDADRGIVINGGTLFACSALGMVETPSTNSEQYVISYAQRSTITAGTVLSIVDSEGATLFEITTVKECQSIIISLPSLQKGATYYIYGGDTKLIDFKISSAITTVGSAAQSNNPGGRPGMGGGGMWRP